MRNVRGARCLLFSSNHETTRTKLSCRSVIARLAMPLHRGTDYGPRTTDLSLDHKKGSKAPRGGYGADAGSGSALQYSLEKRVPSSRRFGRWIGKTTR